MRNLIRAPKLRILSLVLCLVMATVACNQAAPTQSPAASSATKSSAPASSAAAKASGEPIKVGMLMTEVGASAIFAKYEEKGAQYLIDQVNKSGGINGRPIQLVTYDTEGKPDRAAELYRRLANDDKVVAVVGPDSIVVALGMSSVPREVKTLSVSGVGGYDMIKAEDHDYMVTAWSANAYAMDLVLGYFKDKLNVKRIGVVVTADAAGQGTEKGIRDAAEMLGIEVAKTVAQPATDRDLLPSLRELAAVRPPIDAVQVWGSGPFGNIAINQTELAGLNIPIGYTGGNVVPELIKDVGPSVASHVYFAVPRLAALDTLPKDDPFLPELKKFSDEYQAAYGEVPALPSGVGYDMALPIVEALKAVGPDKDKIKETVRTKQQLTGRQGVKFHRTATDGMGSSPLDSVVVGIENGKFVFKDYLKPHFDALKITEPQIIQRMTALNFYTK